MPSFELQHPDDPTVQVSYGWDHALGFFAAFDFGRSGASKASKRAVLEYDALQSGYSQESPLRGCLEFMSEHGLFTLEDLNEAITWFDREDDRAPPKRLRLAVTVIGNLKSAAD